jgi:hypothetical protein
LDEGTKKRKTKNEKRGINHWDLKGEQNITRLGRGNRRGEG